jgi:hypothetical protein
MLGAMQRTAWWGLPWLAVLAISASAGYGLTVAVAGAESAAGRGEIVTTAFDGSVSSDRCDTTYDSMLVYAITTHRIPAEPPSIVSLRVSNRYLLACP